MFPSTDRDHGEKIPDCDWLIRGSYCLEASKIDLVAIKMNVANLTLQFVVIMELLKMMACLLESRRRHWQLVMFISRTEVNRVVYV